MPVIGSRGSGMAAALTARYHGLDVLMVEKEPRFAGTTARSGGWLWIPGTSLAKAWGVTEAPGAARSYLQHRAGASLDADRVDAFLENGPKAVDFFISHTVARFDMPLVFPDYHAEDPGGTQGGGSMVTRPFDGRELGEHSAHLGAPLPELTVFGIMLGSGTDIVHFMRATPSLESAVYVLKRLSSHVLQVLRYGRGMLLTNGNALSGRLAKSAFDLGIPLWLSSPARELIREDGVVRGAIVEHEGRRVRVNARRGVVLACGGFPHDVARRKALFPHAPTGTEHYSPGPTGNTGDGLRMAEIVGGCVDTSLPHSAAWVPVSHLRSGYLQRGGTIAALAHKIGIDAAALERTVSEFNRHAREGKDPQFGKGTTAYNRYQGDALQTPNPCVAPLDKAPYCAIKVVIGDLGTYAGIITDVNARTLDSQRRPIPDLYAVGNDIASIMGGDYPGAGITLGPVLTFGYIAGCHLAGVPGNPGATASGAVRPARAKPVVAGEGVVATRGIT